MSTEQRTLGEDLGDDLGEVGAELLSLIAQLNRWATTVSDLDLPVALARLLARIEVDGTSRISDLARADHCSQPTMTTQVQRLESMGLIERTADPQDARVSFISLSSEGRLALRRARQARAASLRPILGRLSPADRSQLDGSVALLHTLLDLIDRPG